MTDTRPLLRQWQLLKTLSARRHGLSVREMSDEMNVSRKTIRRDLELFQQLAFPLEEIVADRGRKHWRIQPTWTEPHMNFTFDEAIALYIARRFLEPLAGTAFWRATQNAFAKIRASLSESVLAYVERMSDKLHHTSVGAGDYSRKEELLDQLMIGIEDSRAVFITYQSLRATEPVTYDVYPYGIAIHFGSLYLIGYHTDAREVRTWKVDRVEDAEATEIRFQRPEEFDLAKFLAGSFGVFQENRDVAVSIRFSPTVSRYVRESTWHDSQQLTPQRDGSLLAEFRLSSTKEIKAWVLSFGRHAEILSPTSLRAEIVQDLESALTTYQIDRESLWNSQPESKGKASRPQTTSRPEKEADA